MRLGRRVFNVILTATLVASSAHAAAKSRERVITLRADRNPESRRVEITNPSTKPVTFVLGFNDQLLEDEEALLKTVRSSDSEPCRGLPRKVKLACEATHRVATTLVHFPELTDQFGNTGWSPARWWAESPMLSFNSFGFGTCGTMADVLAKVWRQLGYETRRRELNGHTVTEVKAGGKWRLFDADLRGFFVDEKQVLGVDELYRMQIAGAVNAREVHLPVREKDFPNAGLGYYPRLLSDSAAWLGVKDVPRGLDDWRPLTVTIPPGGRLVFPHESGDECFFPGYSDFYSVLGRDLTSPPHRYAVLEVPAGTSTDIINGLYPVQVVGNYCADVHYMDSVIPTDHFDQVRQFQYARRFGRAFKPLEAESAVLIYYMLNANVTIRPTNELRMRGPDVETLRVALISADESYLPPDPAAPCQQVSDEEAIPVRLATASSAFLSPANLIDGQLMTGWASYPSESDDKLEIVLDLGEPQFVRGIRWTPHASHGMLSPASFLVQTSQNGEEYDSVACVEDYRPVNVHWTTRHFDAQYARFVRLIFTPKPHFFFSGSFQATLGEIEVLR